MSMSTLTYGQSINDHYEVIFAQYIQRKNELPPAGWKRAVLHLPPNAARVDPKEQERFMEEFISLIREQCSMTVPSETNQRGLWIDKFDASEVVNKYLRGATLKLYAGKSAPQPVWIDIAPVAGASPGSGFFRT
jgi:hypothetical protein